MTNLLFSHPRFNCNARYAPNERCVTMSFDELLCVLRQRHNRTNLPVSCSLTPLFVPFVFKKKHAQAICLPLHS